MKKKISGIFCIFISPKGDIIGKADCFNQSSPGGYELEEYQKIMAEKWATQNAIKQLTWNEDLHDMNEYHIGHFLDHLKQKGYKFHYFPIEIELSNKQ